MDEKPGENGKEDVELMLQSQYGQADMGKCQLITG